MRQDMKVNQITKIFNLLQLRQMPTMGTKALKETPQRWHREEQDTRRPAFNRHLARSEGRLQSTAAGTEDKKQRQRSQSVELRT